MLCLGRLNYEAVDNKLEYTFLFFFLTLLSGALTFQLHNCLQCMGSLQ